MAVEWRKLAYEDDVIVKALLTGKGDIIYASAVGTPTALAIGGDEDILQVATDVPAWVDPAGLPVAIHAGTHKDGGDDEILLHELGEPMGAVDCNGQQFTDLVLENSADPPAVAVLGKIYFDTDLSAYICTAV